MKDTFVATDRKNGDAPSSLNYAYSICICRVVYKTQSFASSFEKTGTSFVPKGRFPHIVMKTRLGIHQLSAGTWHILYRSSGRNEILAFLFKRVFVGREIVT